MWEFSQEELSHFRATDREECGVIVETNGHVRIERVKNVASGNDDYAILMSDMEAVESSLTDAERILGFFHTHLPHHDPSPSDRDFEGSKKFPQFTNCIYHPSTGSLSWYGVLAEGDTERREAGGKSTSLPQLTKGQSSASDVAKKPLCLSPCI